MTAISTERGKRYRIPQERACIEESCRAIFAAHYESTVRCPVCRNRIIQKRFRQKNLDYHRDYARRAYHKKVEEDNRFLRDVDTFIRSTNQRAHAHLPAIAFMAWILRPYRLECVQVCPLLKSYSIVLDEQHLKEILCT